MFYNFVLGFKQSLLTKLKVSLEQCLILDLLYKFFNDIGSPLSIYVEDEKYYWVSYDMILKNLPILGCGVLKIKRLLIDLQHKKILKKVVRSNNVFININTNILLFEE